MWWAATRAFARCSRSVSGCRGRRSWRLRRRGLRLRSSAVERGCAARRRCRRRRGGASIWRRSRRFGRSFMRWGCGRRRSRARSAAAAAPHRGRRLVACRRCGGTLRGSMRRGFAAVLAGDGAVCRRCRCSTPTTRCGSRLFWATRRMPRARCRGSWRTGADRLRGLPDQLDLPADRARPAVASHRGDTVAVSLPAALHGWLLKLGAGERLRACSWWCRRGLWRC